MLNDQELDDAALQLDQFRLRSEQYQSAHVDILQKYTALIEDYRRLKSDYEEERDSRERYKQMAKGQERNPFVLLLVDGDNYIFDDHLVSSGVEGGQRAALQLDGAIKQSLRTRGLEHCRITVRIYADLAGLSRALAKCGLSSAENRSLGAFAAGFNRSGDLFDFVDAGQLKENADFKIRAMLRHSIDNAQCRHIFFAACHDVGYVADLTPHSTARERITLVRNYAFHPEFAKLGLRVEDFPNLFRANPLDLLSSSIKPGPLIKANTAPISPPAPTVPNADYNKSICIYYQKGNCMYGEKCRFQHAVNVSGDNERALHSTRSTEFQDWRASSQNAKPPLSIPLQSLHIKSPVDNNGTSTHLTPIDFASVLPSKEQIPHNSIAVNSSGERLDFYIPIPAAEDRSAFFIRHNTYRMCNHYHIHNSCYRGDECEYDHAPITPGQRKCLRQLAANQPCPRMSACRITRCAYGHICQRSDCRYRGGKATCRIPAAAHSIDLAVASFVDGKGDSDSLSSANEEFSPQLHTFPQAATTLLHPI